MFEPGIMDYEPSPNVLVFDEPAELERVLAFNARFFNLMSNYNTPNKVLARNIDPLIRSLRRSYEFEDMVRKMTGTNSREMKRAVLIECFSSLYSSLAHGAVKNEFRLHEHELALSWPTLTLSQDPELLPGMQMMVRAVYNRTQNYFRHKGITELTLFRGVAYTLDSRSVIFPQWVGSDFSPPNPLPYQKKRVERLAAQLEECGEGRLNVTYHSPAMSSWTGSLTIAHQCARTGTVAVIFTARIPVQRILSVPFTGWGKLYEQEFFVIGGSMQLLAHVWSPVAPDGLISV